MSNHQIRDLVHTIKSADLTPAQIESAFGEIYLSKDTITNQMESQEIVQQFQSVKCPTYGAHIPNTGKIVQVQGDSGIVKIFTPEDNKSYVLLAASATNVGSGSVNVRLGLANDSGEFVLISAATPTASGGVGGFDTRNVFTFDSSLYPAIEVNTGTAADVEVVMAYAELVQ